MTNYPINSKKKTVFGPFLFHFPNFLGKACFLENSPLSHTTSCEIPATCQNLEQINNTIPRKRPDRGKVGWMEGWIGCIL